jgi:TetR/AcrR family fatty acid metabolism transcriptional regulator
MDVFENIVREGIKEGCFVPDCNVRVYRNMFLGAFTHMSLRWFVVAEKEKADKFREISEFTNLLLDSINSFDSAG